MKNVRNEPGKKQESASSAELMTWGQASTEYNANKVEKNGEA